MKKLVVKEVNKYDYTLVDEKKNDHVLNMEFHGNYSPHKNDIIYMSERMLREENMYTFEETKDNSDDKDIIKVVSINGEFYYKRIYGWQNN